MTIAGAIGGTCTGVTGTVGSNTITKANGTTIPNGGCTITVPVTSSTLGTSTNTVAAGALVADGGTSNASAASASLQVVAAPTVAASFSPSSILPGGTSTLTLTMGNSNATAATLSAAFTNSFPTGVTAVGGATGGTCTGVTAPAANATSVTWPSGATIPAGGCTITVPVKSSTVGTATNTIAANALQTGLGNNASAASATLTVGALPTVAVRKTTSGLTTATTFTYSAPVNLSAAPGSTTVSSDATPVTGSSVTVSALGSAAQFTETATTGFALTAAACTDANGGSDGNPAGTGTFGSVANGVVTIPAANLVTNGVITCALTNTAATWWDGPNTTSNGAVDGGTGTWNATNTNWTDSAGAGNGSWAGGTATANFAGSSGVVTVPGAQNIGGMNFTTSGYALGGAGSLAMQQATTITTPVAGNATVGVPITGTSALTGTGGTLYLTGTNSYSGNTNIASGTLSIGNGGAGGSILSSPTATISSGATLAVNLNTPYVTSLVIAGAGNFVQSGSGTTQLTAQNNMTTFTGTVTVANGTLMFGAGGSLPTVGTSSNKVPIVVNSGATVQFDSSSFGRTDFYTGTITLNNGATMSATGSNTQGGPTWWSPFTIAVPANATATMTAAGTVFLNINVGATMTADVGAGGTLLSTGNIGAQSTMVKAGAGSWVITYPFTAFGGLQINAGTVRIGNTATNAGTTGDLASLTGVTVASGAQFSFNRSNAYTFGKVISGAGTVSHDGAGTTTLTAANTYTGPTNVNSGTLALGINNALSTSTAVTVASGATFSVGANTQTLSNGVTVNSGGALALTSGTLTLGGTSSTTNTLSGTLNMGTSGAMTLAAGTTTLTGTLSGTGTITVGTGATLVLGAGVSDANVAIVMAGGTLKTTAGGANTFGTLTNTVTGSIIDFSSGTNASLTFGNLGATFTGTLNVNGWVQGTSHVYATAVTGTPARNLIGLFPMNTIALGGNPAGMTYWASGAPGELLVTTVPMTYWDGPGTAGNGTIDGGNGTWAASGTNWTNSTGSVNGVWPGGTATATFQGSAGTATLGSGYSPSLGGITFGTSGYIIAGSGSASDRLTLTQGTTIATTGAGFTETISAPIAGSFGITWSPTSSGTLTLSGASSYSGATTVNAGTLYVNGNQTGATGAVGVASGATLGGTGTIGGATTVQSGATLSPGTGAVGALAFTSGLTLQSGSTSAFELGQAGTAGGSKNDLVTVGGNLSLGGTLSVTQSSGGTFGIGTYRLFNYAGSLSGSFASISVPAGYAARIDTSTAQQVNLVVTVTTLQLKKVWGPNSRATDNASIGATSGGTNNTSAFAATGGTAGQSNSVQIQVGDVITLPAEAITPTANASSYTTVLSCTADGGAASSALTGTNGQAAGNKLTIAAADFGKAIVCTYTNARNSATLTLQKAWVNGIVGDSVTIATSGFVNAATLAATSAGSNTVTAPTPVTVYAGETGSITESFATGLASNYTASLSCTGTSGLSGSSLTIGASDTAIICTITNVAGQISGSVFSDTGASGGTANDGIRNGGEAGLAGIAVKLTDCASTSYASTITAASGGYSFLATSVPTGSQICVEKTNAGGSVATQASVGGATLAPGTPTVVGSISYTYTRSSSPDRVAFTWNGGVLTGLDLGVVPDNLFAAGGAKTSLAGSAVSYPHNFTAGTRGTVIFSVPTSTATPAATGWSEKVFADPGCSGALQAGATQLYPPAGPGQSVNAGDVVCVIVQQMAPATASLGSRNDVSVQAGFTYSGITPTASATYTLHDVTTISAASLDLKKEVRNVTQGVATFGISNQAKSGDILEYRITFTNNAAAPITGLTINDTTPAFATFVTAGAGTLPSALTACTKNTPANPAPAAAVACAAPQTVGGTGALAWTFTGALAPGASGTVTFRVMVQ